MENGSKCSIFHNIFKSMIFQRFQKALVWDKGLNIYIWYLKERGVIRGLTAQFSSAKFFLFSLISIHWNRTLQFLDF